MLVCMGVCICFKTLVWFILLPKLKTKLENQKLSKNLWDHEKPKVQLNPELCPVCCLSAEAIIFIFKTSGHQPSCLFLAGTD